MLLLLTAFQHGSRACQRATHWMVTLPHTNVVHLCLIVFPPAALPIHSVPDLFFFVCGARLSAFVLKKKGKKEKKTCRALIQSFACHILPGVRLQFVPQQCFCLRCPHPCPMCSHLRTNSEEHSFIHPSIHHLSFHSFIHPTTHPSIFKLMTEELNDLL